VRIKKHIVVFISFVIICFFSADLFAFDVLDRKTTFEDSKFITLGAGLGATGFLRQKGISGDTGFGFRVSAGHHFNRYLQAEIVYQFSTFEFSSPDPIAPTQFLHTRAAMNQEVLRFVISYPTVLAQPFLSIGFGGYDWVGVNQETALSFPMNFQIPFAAGIRSYIYENVVSFDIEFGYQLLFGENQSSDTLTLLGLNKVSFDTFSAMASFVFHLF